jgi:hypothetical protein
MSELYAWCRDRADNFRAWEHVMVAAPADRDVALVEWVVETLGNPSAPESREVLDALRARHAPSWPASATPTPLPQRNPGQSADEVGEFPALVQPGPIDVMQTLRTEGEQP